MKKNVLFGFALVCSAFLTTVMGANPSVDPAVYTARGASGQYSLSSKWLYSYKLNNYNIAADLIGATATVRGMAVKDGKMLFIDRANKQIVVVDGQTGAKGAPVVLASNIFTYLGRNKANTADSTYTAGTLPFNDIKIDNAGNVLIGNCITSNAGRFQIWKVNMTTGAGTLVIDQANLETLFPTAASMRFDAFGVYGDVNTNAVIMGVNASTTAMEVYKWKITNGVVAAPTLIELDNTTAGTYLTGLANVGSAPQVFPLDENLFYVDGNGIFPTLVDGDGNIVDGFYNKPSALKDSVTAPVADPKSIWTMNQGHNGVVEFQLGADYFLLMAASNTAGVPASTFRLFKFADASKAFSGLDCMWTFPQAGMGSASNSYRTAIPSVEVSGNTAKIYVYTGENGYGLYEMIAGPSAVNNVLDNSIKVSVADGKLVLTDEAALLVVYTVSGQKIASAKNVSSLAAPFAKGVYVVNITDKDGLKMVQKIVLN